MHLRFAPMGTSATVTDRRYRGPTVTDRRYRGPTVTDRRYKGEMRGSRNVAHAEKFR
jgi:hypothetical protein